MCEQMQTVDLLDGRQNTHSCPVVFTFWYKETEILMGLGQL